MVTTRADVIYGVCVYGYQYQLPARGTIMNTNILLVDYISPLGIMVASISKEFPAYRECH